MNVLAKVITLFEVCIIEFSLAQSPVFLVGNYSEEFETLKTTLSSKSKNSESFVKLNVSSSVSFNGKVIFQQKDESSVIVSGSLKEDEESSFFISMNNQSVEGHVFIGESQDAYHYFSEKGKVYVEHTTKDKIICTEYREEYPKKKKQQVRHRGEEQFKVPLLNSYLGANGVVLLDFDGEVVSGTRWNSGATINAERFDFSENEIKTIWEIVGEDFSPVNINITTDEKEFYKYPQNKRMRCIITPTNTIDPQSGGIAYVNSFGWNDDTPCWAFIDWPENTGEVISHELGHTLGLSHDGQFGLDYYRGNGDWAPIMGKSYGKKYTQWSNGDYKFANNKEFDLERISREYLGLGLLPDDHGDDYSKATKLEMNKVGELVPDFNQGLINTRDDKDVFYFETSGGLVELQVTTSNYSNLKFKGILTSSSNKNHEVLTLVNTNYFSAHMKAGGYYFSIEGVGDSNPANGFSDYGSLGRYSVSGSIPAYHYTLTPNEGAVWNLPLEIKAESTDSSEKTIGKVKETYISSLSKGDWLEFDVNISQEGNYTMNTTTRTNSSEDFEIWVDNKMVAKSDEDQYVSALCKLDKGVHTIRYEMNNKGVTIEKITLDECIACVVTASANLISDDVAVYPNPSFDYVRINNSATAFNHFELLTNQGTSLKAGILFAGENLINIHELNAGVYLIKLDNEKQQKLVRIVKN